jgi:hypothetical protein
MVLASWVRKYSSQFGRDKAKCLVIQKGVTCGDVLSRKGGNTKSMIDHLKRHNISKPKSKTSHNSDQDNESISLSDNESPPVPSSPSVLTKQKLMSDYITIDKKTKKIETLTSSKQTEVNLTQNYLKDFQQYERFKEKTPNLVKLYNALSNIQPTSTQSERNFSLSSRFVTKLRMRMLPQHVDALCFLKSYFLNQ